jgi:hypothetical protein
MIVCGKVRFNFYKIVSFITITGFLLALPVISFAQGDLPCDDSDPYNSACPLDNWVWVLAIAAAAFGAACIYRRQKISSRA